MAALVQSYPQQSSTVTMLQTRPSSASGILQTSSQAPHHQYSPNPAQRNSIHGMSNGMSISNYRGHTAVAPIAPYAFTSTPSLATPGLRTQGPYLRPDQRTSSAPTVATFQQEGGSGGSRSRYPAAASVSTSSSSSSSDLSSLGQKSGSRDDSGIAGTTRVPSGNPRPHSTMTTSFTSPNLTSPATTSPVKAAPDRYRRPNNRRAESSTNGQQSNAQPASVASGMPNVMQFYGNTAQQTTAPVLPFQDFNLQMPQFSSSTESPPVGAAADDMVLNRHAGQDQAKRYRRRSIHTIDVGDYTTNGNPGLSMQGSRQVSSANGRIDHQQHPLRSSPVGIVHLASTHGRNGSNESVNSTRTSSRPSSASKREAMAPVTPAQPSPSPITNSLPEQNPNRSDAPRLVNIPPRASSTDAAKRIAHPSPLSKPMTMGPESPASKDSFTSAVQSATQSQPKPTYAQVANGANAESPAARQLAALNDKEGKKSKTSRLRRAFSFGSAAELRKASAENHAINNAAAVDRSKLRKDQYQDEQEAEQARIAQQQEAGGIGSGIYNGQGNFFTGSTDNLSISSTASSASVMIRKMGKGMKKSTRSLVGLFRPKSVIGVPAADAALPEASQAQVSMVTVEAEREKINVNANPHDQVGGGTGYPRLERNSIDAAVASKEISERLGSSGTETSSARRSIVGGEKERAEVLAAVKKGILKRSGTDSGNSSPIIRPADTKTPNFQLPQIPHVNDSPISSAPSTPNEEQQGHRRTGSVTIGGEDYFMTALRFQTNSKSVPSTPQGTIKRNATFSPRIQFHDTWPSGEYDRRGEIATCNRLTPMLAQQIKEELNTFKMEMEVHENSKIYTHFF
ncbi:bni4 [Hyphodiscus hymeniophilus]|uniref:Bni4 n=1 Tax=Hyphodiscus hymeniophilus TaxID=353542 RepID=A0A9P7B034_9HELO|nr:bni4 [Hyphodiscus hymeniophilus]